MNSLPWKFHRLFPVALLLALVFGGLSAQSLSAQMGPTVTFDVEINGTINDEPFVASGNVGGEPWVGSNSGTMDFTQLPRMASSTGNELRPFVPPGANPASLIIIIIIIIDENEI